MRARPVHVLACAAGVAVAVLLGAVMGRATAPDPGPAGPGTQARAQPAAPGPGPVEAGVPVGFARTEDGAVAAATAYTVALDSAEAFDEAALGRMLDAMAADGERQGLHTQVSASTEAIADALGLSAEETGDPSFAARPVPAGYRLRSFDADTAVVEVWGTSVLSAPRRPSLPGGWTTVTVALRWEREGWRRARRTAREGPAPPAPPSLGDAAVAARINAFERYTYAPSTD